MKRILLFTILFFAVPILYFGCASSKPASQEEMKHEYVKEYPNITKDQIFDRAMRWITQNFKSGKSVIDYQDKQVGTIIAKGIIPDVNFGGIGNANLGFTLTIDIKDGKARFDYNNLVPIDPENGQEKPSMSNYERVHKNSVKQFDKMTNEISTAILNNKDF